MPHTLNEAIDGYITKQDVDGLDCSVKYANPVLLIFATLFMMQSATALYENARWTTLDNGLQLVVIENHRAPVIHARLAFRVGSDDERDDQAGLAHYLEHMMFRGSATLAPGAFDAAMSRIGADHNASTSKTLTTYLATFGSQHLETWLSLEADRMAAVALLPSEVESERGVVLTEKLQNFDASPERLWGIETRRRLQGDMAARPVIGRQEILETTTPDDLRAFFDAWYKPNNAAIILSGDVSLDVALPLVEAYFSKFEPGTLPARRPYQGEFNSSQALYEVVDERVTEDRGSILTWMPSTERLGYFGEEALRLRYAAFMLSELVSGELRAPLDRALIVDQGIAKSVSFGLYFDDDKSGASASVDPVPGVDVNEALEALEIALPKAIEESLDPALLARAKRRYIRSAIYANDSVSGPAISFARLFGQDEPWERNAEFEQRVSAVSLADIEEVAAIYFRSDQSFRTTLRKEATPLPTLGE